MFGCKQIGTDSEAWNAYDSATVAQEEADARNAKADGLGITARYEVAKLDKLPKGRKSTFATFGGLE